MSKYSELVALLDWVDKKKEAKPSRFSRSKKTKKEEPVDLMSLLHKKMEEVELINKFLKDQEKINKKEEKKDDKPKSWLDKMSTADKVVFFSTIGPVAGMLYGFMMISLFQKMSQTVGLH